MKHAFVVTTNDNYDSAVYLGNKLLLSVDEAAGDSNEPLNQLIESLETYCDSVTDIAVNLADTDIDHIDEWSWSDITSFLILTGKLPTDHDSLL